MCFQTNTNARINPVCFLGFSTSMYCTTYDAMGSVINDGSGSYTYDVTGNMSHSERGVYVSNYGYNAQNQRVFKTTEDGVEIYAYDVEGRRIGSYVVDSSQPNGIALRDELMYWDNWRVVGIARTTQNTVLHPVLSDHLGAPRKILTPTGSVVWSWDGKDAFGLQSPNENVSSSTFVFDARFPGQWFDKETGLFHNGFRYYNANVGRYTQSDPLGLEAGWNTYAYVAGNPVSAVDYLGLMEKNKNGRHRYDVRLIDKFSHPSGYKSNGVYGLLYTNSGDKIIAYRNTNKNKPNADTNCHGYSFTQGNFWVNDDQVETILRGDGYKKVGGGVYKDGGYRVYGGNLMVNDVIVYKSIGGKVIHSGIHVGGGFISHMPGVSGSKSIISPIYQGWGYNKNGKKDSRIDLEGGSYEFYRK